MVWDKDQRGWPDSSWGLLMGLVFASTARRDQRLREGIILNLTHLASQQKQNSIEKFWGVVTAGDGVGKWVRCKIKLVNMVPVSHLMGWPNGSQPTHKSVHFFGSWPWNVRCTFLYSATNCSALSSLFSLCSDRHRWINPYRSWFGWIGFATPLFRWVIQPGCWFYSHHQLEYLSDWAQCFPVLPARRQNKKCSE